MSEIMPLSPDDGLASPVAGPDVLPREPIGSGLGVALPSGWFVAPEDDRFLTINQDGSTNFGGMAADGDQFVLSGDLVDQPLVLPGEPGPSRVDIESSPDLYTGRHGEMHLTVTDDGRILGGLEGRLDVGGVEAEDDLFVLSGDLADQPWVLPGVPDIAQFDIEPLSDLYTARHGEIQLTVMEDGQILGGEHWFDAGGLYNWA